jgi:hypothetical protein
MKNSLLLMFAMSNVAFSEVSILTQLHLLETFLIKIVLHHIVFSVIGHPLYTTLFYLKGFQNTVLNGSGRKCFSFRICFLFCLVIYFIGVLARNRK